jgi:hypothetical protein
MPKKRSQKRKSEISNELSRRQVLLGIGASTLSLGGIRLWQSCRRGDYSSDFPKKVLEPEKLPFLHPYGELLNKYGRKHRTNYTLCCRPMHQYVRGFFSHL